MPRSDKPIVLVFDTGVPWATDLESVLYEEGGCRPVRIGELADTVSLLRSRAARALAICGARLSPADEIVLKEIRAAQPAAIVVMFSATSSVASLRGALDSGCTAVLPWPSEVKTILRAIAGKRAPEEPRPMSSPQGVPTNGLGPVLPPPTKR